MPSHRDLQHVQELLARQTFSDTERRALMSEAAMSDTGMLKVLKVVLDVESKEHRLNDILVDMEELDYERGDVHMKDLAAEGADLMERCLPLVHTWLPLLWTVGAELSLSPSLVHHCLALCARVVLSLRSSPGAVVDFSEMDEEEGGITVRARSGKKVYDATRGGVLLAVVWVWRDVLLVAVEQGMGQAQVRTMLEGLMDLAQQSGCDMEVDVMFGEHLRTPAEHFLPNAHWTRGQRAATRKVREILANL